MLTPRLARLFAFGFTALATAGLFRPSTAAAEDGPSVQTAAFVRVVADSGRIMTRPGAGDVMATVPQGTVLETLAKDTRHYWVLLERDDYGTRRAGFISLGDIEPLSEEESAGRRRGTRNDQGEPAPAARAPENTAGAAPTLAANVEPPAPRPEVSKTPAATAPRPSTPASEICEVLVHFPFGRSDLADEARQQIERALAEVQGNSQGVFYEIEGHADAVGTEPFNQELGQARAEAVKRYLAEKHSIPLERLKASSYGESRPMASNSTKEGRALNRRVVLKILG